MLRLLQPGLIVVACVPAILVFCQKARADPILELSGAAGFGGLVTGDTSSRFAISPSVSFSIRGERWFFVARDTASSWARPAAGSESTTRPRPAAGCSRSW